MCIPSSDSYILKGGHVFFIGVAHSGLACLGVALVPWSAGPELPLSLGPLVCGCVSWKVTNTAKAAFGALERLGQMQMTTFAVLEMLRILSMKSF